MPRKQKKTDHNQFLNTQARRDGWKRCRQNKRTEVANMEQEAQEKAQLVEELEAEREALRARLRVLEHMCATSLSEQDLRSRLSGLTVGGKRGSEGAGSGGGAAASPLAAAAANGAAHANGLGANGAAVEAPAPPRRPPGPDGSHLGIGSFSARHSGAKEDPAGTQELLQVACSGSLTAPSAAQLGLQPGILGPAGALAAARGAAAAGGLAAAVAAGGSSGGGAEPSLARQLAGSDADPIPLPLAPIVTDGDARLLMRRFVGRSAWLLLQLDAAQPAARSAALAELDRLSPAVESNVHSWFVRLHHSRRAAFKAMNFETGALEEATDAERLQMAAAIRLSPEQIKDLLAAVDIYDASMAKVKASLDAALERLREATAAALSSERRTASGAAAGTSGATSSGAALQDGGGRAAATSVQQQQPGGSSHAATAFTLHPPGSPPLHLPQASGVLLGAAPAQDAGPSDPLGLMDMLTDDAFAWPDSGLLGLPSIASFGSLQDLAERSNPGGGGGGEDPLWSGMLIDAPSAAAAAMAVDRGPLEAPPGAADAIAAAWQAARSMGWQNGSTAGGAPPGAGTSAAAAAPAGLSAIATGAQQQQQQQQQQQTAQGGGMAQTLSAGAVGTAAAAESSIIAMPAGGRDESGVLLQQLHKAMSQVDNLMARQAALDSTFYWAVLQMIQPAQRARAAVAAWPHMPDAWGMLHLLKKQHLQQLAQPSTPAASMALSSK